MNSPNNSHTQPIPQVPPGGYLWYCRGPWTRALRRHKSGAFRLLALIAERTKYSDTAPNPFNLKVGQALIGRADHRDCGLTEKQYRTAQKVLDRLNIVSFEPTPRGTIATIINRAIFDPLTGYELGQQKGQPKHNGKDEHKGQLNGQHKAQVRASLAAGNGPLTNNENNEKKVKTSTRIYELKEQNNAIDQRIEAIKGDKRNFERRPGDYVKKLKPESRREVKELREKHAKNIAELARL